MGQLQRVELTLLLRYGQQWQWRGREGDDIHFSQVSGNEVCAVLLAGWLL